ncbi:MAG: hypothetical protein Q4P18_08250 [Methanobrevibacter sp.]|uniref:hypothetical protein n=1 Tax=Methanobrevibacter sp. TaxID=66852 RepID=UPI0026E074B7|nr:hypothetical protein [Methanobrevibacter sp.]MDO5849513.1 hypothetical protein [Methanobrevibacter sp.]
MLNGIEDLIGLNLDDLEKPYNQAIEEMLGCSDGSIKIAVLEYGVKNCGKRFPREKLFLDKIDFFDIVSFDKLIYFQKLFICWHNNGIVTDVEIYDIGSDLDVLKKDYDFIKDMIDSGKAYLISEGDTEYLGAALTSGKSKSPNSDRLARNRSFVFKKKYLQVIINELGYTCRI